MHKFSTAATKSSALAALRSVGLLNVPYSTFAGASDPQAGAPALARSALSSLREKNLCIIWASVPTNLNICSFPNLNTFLRVQGHLAVQSDEG